MVKRIVLLVSFLFLLMPCTSAGTVLDRVVGVVDGDVITLSDLDKAMPRYGMARILDEGNPLDKEIRLRQARQAVLEMLIEERLLQKVASQYNFKVEEEAVEKAIAQMKQEGNKSDEQMKKELAAQGLSLEEYRRWLAILIRRGKIIEALIGPTVVMTEQKLRDYYQSHADNYLTPEVRVSQILIQLPAEATPKDREAARKKMEVVVQKLKKGSTFEEMAARYSDDKASALSGGDLGFFVPGEMIPALEELVFSMNVGGVTEVIQASQGLILFKVTERRAGALPPFEDVQERVKQDYYRQEVIRLYARWLDDLKARSNVEIKL
jgi:peptidyl-prolyl cis-trans isomerase SurA